jgi:hypothetical protein
VTDLSVFGSIGLSIDDVEILGQGRNGLVAKVLSGEFAGQVAKWYGPNKHHEFDRLEREFQALAFLRSCSISEIPQPIANFQNERISIHSFVPGERPGPNSDAISPMFELTGTLSNIYQTQSQAWAHNAAEATFKLGDIFDQIQSRILRAERAADHARPPLPLVAQLSEILNQVRAHYSPEYALVSRTLSPSDFGPHNMLQDGHQFSFVDFEYFGIDAAARVVLDVLWHPGTNMGAQDRLDFVAKASMLYAPANPSFDLEVAMCLPLIGLRWATIMFGQTTIEHKRIAIYLEAVNALLGVRSAHAQQLKYVAEVVAS